MRTSRLFCLGMTWACHLVGIVATAGNISCEPNGKPASRSPDRLTNQPAKWVNSNLTIEVNSTAGITLKWAPLATVSYYRVYRSTTPELVEYYGVVGDALANTTFDDDRVDAGTTYYYWVYSINRDDSTTKIGQASATTPTHDDPLK